MKTWKETRICRSCAYVERTGSTHDVELKDIAALKADSLGMAYSLYDVFSCCKKVDTHTQMRTQYLYSCLAPFAEKLCP